VESLSRESLLSLLESLESAIGELQSLHEPRLDAVISRLERRRAEIVAALASKGRPEQYRRRGARGSLREPRPENAVIRGDTPRRHDDRNPLREADH